MTPPPHTHTCPHSLQHQRIKDKFGLLLLWLLVVATLQVEGAPDSTHLFDCKEAQDELIPTYPTPLVVLVSGCSMSSAAGQLSRRLLKAHGVAIADKTQLGGWEVLTSKNPCRQPDASQMLANLVATAASQNMTILIKLNGNGKITDHGAAAFVRRFTRARNPPRFVKWTRENRLDHLVCSIKDCFQGGKGGGAGKSPLL